jgi:hypothetical protein
VGVEPLTPASACPAPDAAGADAFFTAIFEVVGLSGPAGTAAVPAAAGEATVPPPGLVPASRASPVVVPVAMPRGSFTNLIWPSGTAMFRLPMPNRSYARDG